MIKAEAVVKVIVDIMKEQAEYLGDIIAFDGKAIRSTSDKGRGAAAGDSRIAMKYLPNGCVHSMPKPAKTFALRA